MNTYYTFYEQTIIDNIDFESYGLSNDCNLYDKIQNVYSFFKSEHVYQNNQHLTEHYLFSEWLRGLPNVLSVPFLYVEIINNALDASVDVKEEDIFCSEYWNKLSEAFFTLKENL